MLSAICKPYGSEYRSILLFLKCIIQRICSSGTQITISHAPGQSFNRWLRIGPLLAACPVSDHSLDSHLPLRVPRSQEYWKSRLKLKPPLFCLNSELPWSNQHPPSSSSVGRYIRISLRQPTLQPRSPTYASSSCWLEEWLCRGQISA